MQTPSDYIDSKEYFSWERYFTALLTEKTAGTYLNYTKKALNEAYLRDGVKNTILGQMKNVKLNCLFVNFSGDFVAPFGGFPLPSRPKRCKIRRNPF